MKIEILKCGDCGRLAIAVNDERVTDHKCSGRWTVVESAVIEVDTEGTKKRAPICRAERKRIADSIGLWMKEKATHVSEDDPGRNSVLVIASDLMNGEWDEDTLGGTVEAKL